MTPRFPRLHPWTRSREAVRQLLNGATVDTCLPVALVVGTVLSVVNQGDVVVQGMAGVQSWSRSWRTTSSRS